MADNISRVYERQMNELCRGNGQGLNTVRTIYSPMNLPLHMLDLKYYT